MNRQPAPYQGTKFARESTDMYGWRGRIGLIVPSTNTSMEAEFWRYAPRGVTIHSARMILRESTAEDLGRMEGDVQRCVEELRDCANMLVYGCTAGGFVKGLGYEREVEEDLSRQSGLPAVSSLHAVVQALRALEIRRLALLTPYPKALNDIEEAFFDKAGFEVTGVTGLDILLNVDIGRVPSFRVYGAAMDLAQHADGIFISCSNLPTFDIIDLLSRDSGKPVVTSGQATFWRALRTLGVGDRFQDLGELLSAH